MQVVSPRADDLVFSRAIAQLVLVDVIAPGRVSILIEGNGVPCNACGGRWVSHSFFAERLPKGWEDYEPRTETPLGKALHGTSGEDSPVGNT